MQIKTVWNGGKAFTAIGDTGYEMNMDVTEEFGGEGKEEHYQVALASM